MDVAEIPVHPNVGMGVGGVPMSPYPPADAVSRVSRALVDILRVRRVVGGRRRPLGMACTHALASGMGGMRTAGDLVARMQMTRGMRLKEAKRYVAGKLGCAVRDLADPIAMHDVRRELGLGRIPVQELTYPDARRAPWRPSSVSPRCSTCRSTASRGSSTPGSRPADAGALTTRNPRKEERCETQSARRRRRSGGLSVNVFTEDELDDIHLATLEVLERTGVFVEDDEALDIFSDGGCGVDRETRMVQHPAARRRGRDPPRAAEQSCSAAATPKNDIVLEPGRVGFTNFGEGIKVIDPYTGEYRDVDHEGRRPTSPVWSTR